MRNKNNVEHLYFPYFKQKTYKINIIKIGYINNKNDKTQTHEQKTKIKKGGSL